MNNGKRSNKSLGFVCEGWMANAELNDEFAAHAQSLSHSLKQWPSCGLTAVAYLTPLVSKLQVTQMPLLPSLIRPEALCPRMPLPSAFHNWFGERRLVFSGALEISPWPSVLLPCPAGGESTPSDRWAQLLALAQLPRQQGQELLAFLANVSASSWLEEATPERLQAAEALFHLDRQHAETCNWWLYDFAGSAQADAIFQRLAWCQQQVLLPSDDR
ncbi:hypothetical protein [Ferrimonas balearica]|uniref:hypothetical protein n=1 Tax=Ferrimonas balearica TaxID=44012 RepID=UPI001C5651C5|nr:hypothetical protein [Ferrimonas balearica]MBW3164593.1 hypothetical protein [Ferrimonas balearica]